jgi:formate hydrogenlyase transcriptional activator
LNVFPIHLPPLGERAGDIPALVRYFLDRFARRMNRPIEVIPDEALAALQRCAWPGNIRELSNLIERAVILSSGPTLEVPIDELDQPELPLARKDGGVTLAQLEQDSILGVLEESNWLIAGRRAAARLGMKRTTLQSLLKRLEISRPVLSLP